MQPPSLSLLWVCQHQTIVATAGSYLAFISVTDSSCFSRLLTGSGIFQSFTNLLQSLLHRPHFLLRCSSLLLLRMLFDLDSPRMISLTQSCKPEMRWKTDFGEQWISYHHYCFLVRLQSIAITEEEHSYFSQDLQPIGPWIRFASYLYENSKIHCPWNIYSIP